MGWGDTLNSAWNSATDSAKAAAKSAMQTAQGAYDYGKQTAGEVADYASEKANQAYDYAKQKANEGYGAAKQRARDAERGTFDKGYDAVAGAVETGRRGYNSAANAAGNAYHKARSALGMEPAGKPVQPCPRAVATMADPSVANEKMDGWLMSPQGPGKPCIAIPPNSDGLANARKRAIQSDSACCQARRGQESPRDIIYVNGIQTDAKAHCDTLNKIAAQTCARVVGVYNATEGFASDGAQTGQDRRLVKAAAAGKSTPGKDGRNPAVDTLARTIADEVEAGRPPEVWTHSQGGAVTSLAMYEANNDLAVVTGERNSLGRMKVKSFGSAAPQWVDGPQYEHYVHMNDPVPTMLGLGHDPATDAALAGKGARVIRFSGDVTGNDTFKTADPHKEWLPTNLDNHAVDKSYLKMEKQRNGGCP